MNGLSYGLAARALPLLDSFRAPARFAVLVLLAVAVLAGLAVTSLATWIRRPRTQMVFAGVVAAALMTEYWSAPVATAAVPLEPPAVYQWLARQPETVILELPAPAPEALWKHETTYQYLSIYHWQPLVNGYSGYAPRSYLRLLETVRDFPSALALHALHDRRVSVVLLHERFMSAGEFDRILTTCADRQRFVEVRVFDDPMLRRTAVCRLASRHTLKF
jgi:hypothetical protein